jgi:hypothetical protein
MKNLLEILENVLEALEIGHQFGAELAEDYHIRNKGFTPARHDEYDRQVELIDKARKDLEQIVKKMKEAPPECQTDAEKTAYAFGWYKALEANRPVIDESAAKRIATALGWEPKREWVGLTDEEMIESEQQAGIRYRRHRGSIRGQQLSPADEFSWHYAKAIEAKLKEKNT